ncbi:MAG: hypothetical protein AB8B63_21550 [Granulosicoccus sp.]
MPGNSFSRADSPLTVGLPSFVAAKSDTCVLAPARAADYEGR